MTQDQEPGGGTLPASQAVDLAGLVDYAEGSIVSRTLVENDAGTLTLFAFDQGQGLSEHTTPFDALVHVLDGEAELTIGGETVAATAGQAVLMPADVPHAVKAARRFKMLLTMLRATK
jgi:quercetin dioxygenase-like cupin family protein